MGKVKDEEKLSNEVVSRKKKKRKKELDLLRRKVLEAKRKLREKTAPPKTHVSTFDKVLNSFADRRQANDNKTQGFDSKGRRAGLKKMCNRLLPSRKPQVGIFANGSRGAEIKRGNLSLYESDRARFESDLQKVLNDGKRRCTESRSDALNIILRHPSPGTMDTVEQESIQIPDDNLERQVVQNLVAERQCGKRKLEAPTELDGKVSKIKHSEVEKAKVVSQAVDPGVAERSNSSDKKWKRSLFIDEDSDFVSISDPAGVEQLRFSPTIVRAKAGVDPAAPKASLDPSQGRSGIEKMIFKYGQLGRMAPAKYEQLCGMVCAENFETCLQEIPHIDPLTKVKQSLLDVYVDTCNLKSVRDKTRLKVPFPGDPTTSDSHPVRSNVQESKYFHDRVNVSPLQGVGPDHINSKNFSRWKATETFPAENKSLMTKSGVKLSKNIPLAAGGASSSETSITEQNMSSLEVNYDSSRQSLRSEIQEFLKVDTEVGPSVGNLDNSLGQKFAGISSTRKRIMWRYLNEENNPEPLNEVGSIYPAHGSAASAENDNVQKCYLPDPPKRREIENKKHRHAPERKLDEIRDPTPSKGGIAESTANSADANSDNVRPCLGLSLGDLPKINRKSRLSVVNLGSASSSLLGRIPTNREEIMQRYLKDVNKLEPRKQDRTTLPPKVVLDVAEDDKLKKRYLGDPLRRHQMKNTLFDRPSKNERHVPSILRKSHSSKRNKTSNTAGTVLARGVLEIGNIRLKTTNFNFERVSSGSDGTVLNNLLNKKGAAKKAAITGIPFTHSTNPGHLINTSPNMQFVNRAATLEPPIGLNALYDPSENGSRDELDFMDLGFTPEVTTGRENMANPSEGLNFSGVFNQPPSTYRQQYPGDNVGPTNFPNGRQPLNLPIFHHHQRPDASLHRAACDERDALYGDQDSRRFPVFLKRTNALVPQKETSYERQRSRLFPEVNEPKVIILQNPSLRGVGEEARCGMNATDLPYKNDGQRPQRNGTGFPFAAMAMVPTTVQVQNCRQFHAPDAAYKNASHRGEQLQVHQCVCKNDLQNVQQVPMNMYQNKMRKGDPMSFIEPTTFEVETSHRMFQQASTSNGQIPGSYGSLYGAVNANAEVQHHSNNTTTEPVQFFDRRVGFVLPKNDSDPFCQTAINLPINSDQMVHRQKYRPVLSEDRSCNSKYFIDPRCPQAGYNWNQINGSGAQVHQRVIQPVYNVTDAYRPQVPRNYYSTDS